MKSQALLEVMDPLFPADFFLCSVKIAKAKDKRFSLKDATKLPDVSELLAEEGFGSFFLSWHEEALMGCVVIEKPFTGSFFPDYPKGDAIEIFIDTRDNKSAGIISSFCHHFVLLPGEVNGVKAQEITRFRLEDSHPLCEASILEVDVKPEKTQYTLFFTLPKEALHGYDPLQCPRFGFAYRIHGFKGRVSHFPFSSKRFEPLQHPSLWASLVLIS